MFVDERAIIVHAVAVGGANEQEAGAHVTYLERICRLFLNL